MNNLKEFDNYIVQLVETMRESAEHLPDPPYSDDYSEFESKFLPDTLKLFTETEQSLKGNTKPLGDITGIRPEMLPPLFKLNDAQATFLTDEMIRLLRAFNIFPDFPRKLPDHIKYRLLREIWSENVLYIKDSELHLVFCNYKPEECPFPNNCCHCRNGF